jgi:hypothetical protein
MNVGHTAYVMAVVGQPGTENSGIIYASPRQGMLLLLLRLGWSKQDPRCMATIIHVGVRATMELV